MLVIGCLDLKLSEKQAEQMLAAARLAAPTSCPCLLNSVRETLIFNIKLLYSVFLPVLITGSVCFEEEETSADNSAPGKNILNHEHLSNPNLKKLVV